MTSGPPGRSRRSGCAASSSRTARLASAARPGTSATRRSTSRPPPRSRLPGTGHRPALRRRGRGGGPPQGRRRRARPDHQPAPLPARRPAFRGVQRGPGAHRRPRRRLRDGVQDNGVGATPKHYVANDSETDRFTVDVRVGDRALRELYLLAFEKAVTEAHAWLVMSSYNSVNGTTATENDLLETPLNSEWGFDGVVISDWTAVRSLDSAAGLAGPRHARPGRPVGRGAGARPCAPARSPRRPSTARWPASSPWRAGSARSTGSPPPSRSGSRTASPSPGRPPSRAPCCWRTAASCRWDPARLRSVAVIGDNAANARTQGGGSATVMPGVHRLAAGRPARRAARRGRHLLASAPSCRKAWPSCRWPQMTNPVTGEPGLRVRFLDAGRHRAVRRGPPLERAGLVRRRRPDRPVGHAWSWRRGSPRPSQARSASASPPSATARCTSTASSSSTRSPSPSTPTSAPR